MTLLLLLGQKATGTGPGPGPGPDPGPTPPPFDVLGGLTPFVIGPIESAHPSEEED